jgi:citronellol/citronellal dehydrogenase
MIPEERGGKICLIAPRADAGDHAGAARDAAENLARVLSIEWSRFGIRPVAVKPGARTSEEELATVVAYLASPAGDYFSGAVLTIDGARDNWFGPWPPPAVIGKSGEPLAEERS